MAKYTIQDLERLSGVRQRTIRDWIARGLLPGADRRGPGATYSRHHLQRLLAIRHLKEGLGLALDRIADLLAELPEEEVERLAAGELDPMDLVGVSVPAAMEIAPFPYIAAESSESRSALPCHEAPSRNRRPSPKTVARALDAVARALGKRTEPDDEPGRVELWVEVPVRDGLVLRLRDPGPRGRAALERLARVMSARMEEVAP